MPTLKYDKKWDRAVVLMNVEVLKMPDETMECTVE